MSKILFISKLGDGLDLALKCQREGADVKVHIVDPDERHLYNGILPKVSKLPLELEYCDFVVFDCNAMEEQKRLVWRSGKPAFGMGHSRKYTDSATIAETLETDRKMVHDLMNSLGMGSEHETCEFKSVEEAIQYLKENEGPYVVKPESKMIMESNLTLIGEFENNEDTIAYLETFKFRPETSKIDSIALEKRLQGIEVAVSGWFNGKDWLDKVCVNFENKKFATGDLGFLTGETGTLMYYTDKSNPLFIETLNKLGPMLAEYDYRGEMDVNCIANEDGIFPLELTPRLGYPAIFIEEELHITPWSKLLEAIAKGQDIDLKVKEGWAIGVVGMGEGFPCDEEGKKRMMYMPIIGYAPDNQDHIHLCEAIFKNGKLMCSGMYPLVYTATGSTVKEAQDKIYNEIIPSCYFPKVFYRTDIGDRVQRGYDKLKGWGYL